MRTRNAIIGAIVLLVATAATTFVIVDRRQPEGVPFDGGDFTVIVSKEDIPANQLLDPLIEDRGFVEISVPHDALVDGALTDVRQLKGATTAAVILANEQIPIDRLIIHGDQIYPLGPNTVFEGRERMVLGLLAEGLPTREIARLLGVSRTEMGEIVRDVITKLRKIPGVQEDGGPG